MTKEPSMEEILAIVEFERDEGGCLCVTKVKGTVRGNVEGSVVGGIWGSVWGGIGGDVRGNVEGSVWGSVWCSVMGSVLGKISRREWQFAETPEERAMEEEQ